jgi:hypothetical protein
LSGRLNSETRSLGRSPTRRSKDNYSKSGASERGSRRLEPEALTPLDTFKRHVRSLLSFQSFESLRCRDWSQMMRHLRP